MLQHDLATLRRMAGNDGASAQVWPAPREEEGYEDELELLLQTWSIERGRAIEAELLLTRARDLLARAVAPGKAPSLRAQRRARRLLVEIDRLCGPGRTA